MSPDAPFSEEHRRSITTPISPMIDSSESTQSFSAPMVPEETSGRRVVGAVEASPAHETGALSPTAPTAAAAPSMACTDAALEVEQRRRRIWDTWQGLKATNPHITRKEVALLIGCGEVTLWRLEHDVQERGEHAFEAKLEQCGRKSDWEALLDIEAVRQKLRDIYTATLGASCTASTLDRRTGNIAAALKAFSAEPECPAALAPKLLRGNFPACLRRFMARITPEVESLIRGEKHFQLSGFTGRREKAIGLPDGRRAYLPAGWVMELDDMSVNQPFWVEGPTGPVLSRQGLYARCLKGGWRGVELVATVRESYTAAIILRFIRRLCELHGKPRKIRIEKSVWAANAIAGFKLVDDTWQEEVIERPAMGEEDRENLCLGLAALGIEVEFCVSARGKSDLEGAFNPLQTYLAINTRDFPNIGRHAGEFEHAAKQLRRVRAGSHHPRDLGFPHQTQLLERILKTFDFINAMPRGTEGSFDQVWLHDTTKWPLAQLAPRDYAAFLPVLRQREITGGAVYPQADGREFAFRALEFAELGDGYRVYVRFDPSEPSLGAAIYNREPRNDRNYMNYAEGQLIGMAQFEVPGCTTYAESVPADLPTYSVEDRFGQGAKCDEGELLGHQRGSVRKFVRTAFGGSKPGQPHVKAVEQRQPDGSLARAEIGGTHSAAPTSNNRTVAVPTAPRQNSDRLFAPQTEDQRTQRRSIFARQAEIANRLRELASET